MKAGSLPCCHEIKHQLDLINIADDDAVALRAVQASPSSGEVCLEVCSRHCSLCLHLFFSTANLRFEILHVDLKSEIRFACVAEQQKHSTVDRASAGLRRCESYHMHQTPI